MTDTNNALLVQHFWLVCRDDMSDEDRIAGRGDVTIRASARSVYDRLRRALPDPSEAELYRGDVVRAKQTGTRLFPNWKWELSEHLLPRDFGSWEGMTWEQVRKNDPLRNEVFWNDPVAGSAPNGETLSEVQERLGLFCTSLTNRSDWTNAIVLLDPNMVRLLVAYVLEIPLKNLPRLGVAALSVTHVSHSWFGWSLVGFNHVP